MLTTCLACLTLLQATASGAPAALTSSLKVEVVSSSRVIGRKPLAFSVYVKNTSDKPLLIDKRLVFQGNLRVRLIGPKGRSIDFQDNRLRINMAAMGADPFLMELLPSHKLGRDDLVISDVVATKGTSIQLVVTYVGAPLHKDDNSPSGVFRGSVTSAPLSLRVQ